LSKHGDKGIYSIHVYTGASNPDEFITDTIENVKDYPPYHLTILLSEDEATVDLAFNQADDYDEIQIPVWSDAGGQDDIVWYQPQKKSNGIWTLQIKVADHCGVVPDTLFIHVYGKKQGVDDMVLLTTRTMGIKK